MSTKKITPQRELFLEYLFNDPECANDTRLAAEKAGLAPDSHLRVARELKDEILVRGQEAVAMMVPEAVGKLSRIMGDDSLNPKADLRLKAVETVLDRAGIAKKQQLDVVSEVTSPLFFISKKIDSEEDPVIITKKDNPYV